MSNYENIKQSLLEKRKELESRIGKINKDYANSLSPDSSEQAVELENSEVLAVIQREAVDELTQINRALQMIDSDTYGICIACETSIPPKRLEVLPHTNYCIDCAESNR